MLVGVGWAVTLREGGDCVNINMCDMINIPPSSSSVAVARCCCFGWSPRWILEPRKNLLSLPSRAPLAPLAHPRATRYARHPALSPARNAGSVSPSSVCSGATAGSSTLPVLTRARLAPAPSPTRPSWTLTGAPTAAKSPARAHVAASPSPPPPRCAGTCWSTRGSALTPARAARKPSPSAPTSTPISARTAARPAA